MELFQRTIKRLRQINLKKETGTFGLSSCLANTIYCYFLFIFLLVCFLGAIRAGPIDKDFWYFIFCADSSGLWTFLLSAWEHLKVQLAERGCDFRQKK